MISVSAQFQARVVLVCHLWPRPVTSFFMVATIADLKGPSCQASSPYSMCFSPISAITPASSLGDDISSSRMSSARMLPSFSASSSDGLFLKSVSFSSGAASNSSW